ncbi:MAG TPA: M15 family metallopeptidase [Blastocatellia bacterium]|nr:M15 family metallopeptidase [Blastocatellia bacterium]
MSWSFGGKSQRGWYLYQSLICRLIATEGGPESSEFAAALSRWQKAAGLTPSGILDQETWMAMVATFQARRPKGGAAPSSDQLVQVPASEFYDPSRPDELRYVDRQAYAAYKRMVAAAAADQSLKLSPSDHFLSIISAYRSPAYQAQLRQRSPHAGRAGLALHSPHSTGLALDVYVGGDPVSTKDQNRAIQVNTRVYQWLVRNAERFGFHPYFYEPWHWEYRPQPAQEQASDLR